MNISQKAESRWKIRDFSRAMIERTAGFGSPRSEPESEAERDVPIKVVPFLIWPDSRDEAQCRQAIVNGPLTEAKKEAVEALAWEFLEERGAACDTLIWRLKPEWESERSFEHQTQRHILRMQAGFYNDTWP